jgi:endonuclease YncB( thermonuclease family)
MLNRQVLGRSLIAVCLTGCFGLATAETLTGEVVAVADGDTITVLDDAHRQHRVRLAGIDAPEKRQPFGTRARESLGKRVFRHVVQVNFKKLDRYGRIVGKVTLDGADVCLEQVTAGLAWHYVAYQREQSPEDRRAYARAEAEAREARRGLWADSHPEAPWDFRQKREPPGQQGTGSHNE